MNSKPKAASQEERMPLWKQHFENLLGKPQKVTDEHLTKIISNQLHIKLGQFMHEEFDLVLRKTKNRKYAGLDRITPEVWKTRKFDDVLLRYCNAVYNQNTIDRGRKGCILPFPKNRWHQNGQELPKYNPYFHSGWYLQCSATQPYIT